LKIFYINLDSAKKRKKAIKKQAKKYNIKLNRIAPVTLNETKKIFKNYNSNITLPEASLFLTNEKILKQNLNSNEHILILEDDVKFSKFTNEILNLAEIDFSEDIIFLECNLNLLNIEYLKNLKILYKKLKNNNQFQKIEAKKYYLSGATAVIYNKNSIQKILNFIQNNRFSTHYDLFLRNLIQTNLINAKIIFPFSIGLNLSKATKSQLATKKDKLLQYSFLIRDSFFVENNLKSVNKYYLKFVKNYIN